MILELIRIQQSRLSCEGLLLVNGLKICCTTENTHNALPAGTYPVVMSYCERKGARTPLICTEDSRGDTDAQPLGARTIACPQLPDAWTCKSCMRTLRQREAIYITENDLLLHAIADGMAPRLLAKYERHLDARRRRELAGHRYTVCPRFCPGFGIHGHDDAGILLGTRLLPGCLTHSRAAYAKLLSLLKRSRSPITLHITEYY